MSIFWIVGIVLNVSLTGLILYWLIKQAKPQGKQNTTDVVKPSPTDTDSHKSVADDTEVE